LAWAGVARLVAVEVQEATAAQRRSFSEHASMSTEQLLDRILVPRPNGSEGLSETASFIEASLRLRPGEPDP
jgi:hypothetical protein